MQRARRASTSCWCWPSASTIPTTWTPTTGRPNGGRPRSSGRWPRSTRDAAGAGGPGCAAAAPPAGAEPTGRAPPPLPRAAARGAARARARCCRARRLSFDEESKALYDAVAPRHDVHGVRGGAGAARQPPARAGPAARPLHALPRRLRDPAGPARRHVQGGDRRLPPPDAGARARCRPARRFTVEYVTGKSWSGYNWYQGDYRSLIQVNTDLPIFVDRAIDLACHEGYPGPSRLQRAAREDAGARSRLARVSRSTRSSRRSRSSPRARPTTASRSRSRRRSGWTFERERDLSRRRARPGRRRALLRGAWAWWIACRMPATRRRGATSTARSTPRRRPRWLETLRPLFAGRAPSSACGSSTSTAAT